MKKLLVLFLTMAFLCTITITTTGCKGSTPAPPAEKDTEKKDEAKKDEAKKDEAKKDEAK